MKTTRRVRRWVVALALLLSLILLIGAYVLITSLGQEKPPVEEGLRYEPIAGEDPAANRVYPTVQYEGKGKNATYLDVSVEGEGGRYGIFKSADDSTFYIYYYDEAGEKQIYLPPVAALDPSFDYTSVYATDDMGLGTGMPRILYLPIAAGNISFNERIPLEDATREQTLAGYGLDEAAAKVTLMYVDTEGKTVTHTLHVGDTTPGNNGYYMLVDDRPYVYATSTSTPSYFMKPLTYYVSPTLVSPGTTDGDYSQHEGYLALSFKEFVNRVYTKDDGALTVPAEATVLLRATERPSGKQTAGPLTTYEFSLPAIAGDERYERLYRYLVGNTLGEVSHRYTQLLEADASRRILLEGVSAVSYDYTVLRVDALLRADGEVTTGTVGTDTLLKLTYLRRAPGEEAQEQEGILDLSQVQLSPETTAALAALPVGQTLSDGEQVTFTYSYTESSAQARSFEMVIEDILAIYDAQGEPTAKITDSSILYCRYRYDYEGTPSDAVLGTLDIGAATGAYKAALTEKLVGLGVGEDLEIHVYTYTELYEVLSAYAEYDIRELSSYVTEEEIVSFGFRNQADRDPFYLDSYFANELPESNKHSIYGLNDISCLAVTRLLAGLESNSTSAGGLFGTETVAIGLSAQVMEKYHLYDNRVYIEFPRGITSVTDAEGVTEFRWLYTLGFTMYVSDVQYDADTGKPFRYVGSDMYDVVTRVEADMFDYVDYSFTEFWARETMFLVDMDNLDSLRFEMFFDDFSGSYDFIFDRIKVKDHLWTRMDVIPVGSTYEPLRAMMAATGLAEGKAVGLNAIYDYFLGVTDAVYGKEYAGDGYFKDFLENLFYIGYSGTLTEEEQARFETSGALLMRMTADMNVKSNLYVYEFYRGSDRRVMVRQYRTTEAGVPIGEAVEEFYISSFAFKKIATGVEELLSGRPISGDNEYGG